MDVIDKRKYQKMTIKFKNGESICLKIPYYFSADMIAKGLLIESVAVTEAATLAKNVSYEEE